MYHHEVRVQHPGERFPRERELAWRLAEVACGPVPVEPEAAEMVGNRVLDDVAVAAAALDRDPPAAARAQALAHPRRDGATVLGLGPETRVEAEWAAWANGTAVRELDFHDTFLAADFAHPGDNIPPLLATAQQCRRSGADLVRGIVTAYEVQVALTRAIDLHSHRIDHVAHLGPSVAAGLGALLGLTAETTYQAINQALHVTTATRQSRKGTISSWKAFAAAHAGKLAVEAVDRAMRGQRSPAPIWEGEDGVVARLLDGPDACYLVTLPEPGEPRRAILDTFTKAHAAEYQAQAFIDLAFRLRDRVGDTRRVERVVLHTSDHTHNVIGTGAGDPEKLDPAAPRETLDHSVLCIFAVALQDGRWHHVDATRRSGRPGPTPCGCGTGSRRSRTSPGRPRYHDPDPARRAFGGRAEIHLAGGEVLTGELAVADAHPLGAAPFTRPDYSRKLATLAGGVVDEAELDRFADLAERLDALAPDELGGLTVVAGHLAGPPPTPLGSSDVVPGHGPGPPAAKRAALRAGLASGRLLRMPGAFSPLVARLVEELGFDGAYVSGAVVAADLGLPDVGLTTLTEVGRRARQIASATSLPVLADADTGFGEPLNAARTVAELDDLGLAGCHLEDQVNPKRCGHLDGKEVVPAADMVRRLQAAVAARRDPGFLVVARSDARAVEGLGGLLERARAYVDAGAEMLFPEALADEREFEAVRRAVDVPLLANMTEFGRSKLLDARTLAELGVNLVIYPVTGLRLAMGAVEDGLRRLRDDGTQAGLVDRMQTRARLYELLGYRDYAAFDRRVHDFEL